MEDTITMIEDLGAMDEGALEKLVDNDKETYLRLLMAIGALINKSCGNLNKLYEKTTQLDLSIKNGGDNDNVIHVKHSYGADIRVKDEETGLYVDGELKTSVVWKKDRHKANWIFCIPSDATYETLKIKYSGTVRLTAIWGNTIFKSYLLSGRFVALYMARCVASLHESKSVLKINMGGCYCETHDTYHRIAKYLKYDALLKRADDVVLTEDEWTDILKKETKCLKK